MSFGCRVGDTIQMVDDSGGVHRYVVLTPPNKSDCVVIVNFTSATGRIIDGKMFTSSDSKGLFPCPTIVPYKYATLFPVASLHGEVNRRDEVSDYKPCPQTILKQIIKDAFKSQFTKDEVIEELKTHYPKEYGQYYA